VFSFLKKHQPRLARLDGGMGIVRILMGVYVGSYKKEEKLALSCKGEFGTIG
jgi:hypothetical protein